MRRGPRPGGGTVYTGDLKSPARKGLWVRIPPWAPKKGPAIGGVFLWLPDGIAFAPASGLLLPLPRMQLSERFEKYRFLIGMFKFLMGGIEAVIGATLLLASYAGLSGLVERALARELIEDPNDEFVRLAAEKLFMFIDHKTAFGAALLCLGIVKIVATIGFLQRRTWGYMLLLAIVALAIPAELYHLIDKPGLISALVTCGNALVLGCLVAFRKQLTGHDRWWPWPAAT